MKKRVWETLDTLKVLGVATITATGFLFGLQKPFESVMQYKLEPEVRENYVRDETESVFKTDFNATEISDQQISEFVVDQYLAETRGILIEANYNGESYSTIVLRGGLFVKKGAIQENYLSDIYKVYGLEGYEQGEYAPQNSADYLDFMEERKDLQKDYLAGEASSEFTEFVADRYDIGEEELPTPENIANSAWAASAILSLALGGLGATITGTVIQNKMEKENNPENAK
jgi:hypothetical protein